MAKDVSSLKALCFGVFFCFSLAHFSSASCEQNALGLGDGNIQDIQLNASSKLNANTPAKNGRLNFTAGSSWCASASDPNPHLQIDLQTVHIICAVFTQGNSKEDQWVESYTLESSRDGTSWTGYKEDGQENKKNFNGNYNRNGTVKHILYSGIVARYLRFVVGDRHDEACLRVEIFGVPIRTACVKKSVGISNSRIIHDQRFSASSSLPGNKPSNGRLNGASAWKPRPKSDVNDFLQIDLGSVFFICGVATQGNPKANDWTKTFKLCTSLNNVNWVVYVENDTEKIFAGNSDQNTVVRNDLYQPPAAKFIRFYPVLLNNSKALRVEVYGSLQGCLSSMGNERFVNRDVRAEASSELKNSHRAIYSRLYGLNSWCSASVAPPQYLDFNFGKVITVSGVATQGDNRMDKWVESYSVSYGYDGKTWLKYSAGMTLTGNIDKHSIVVNWFSSPFAAQYIRITPKTYKDGICMRVDLLGCENFQVPFLFVNKLADVDLTASPGAIVTLTCVAKFSQERAPTYVWSKDGALLPESSFSLKITYTSATSIHNDYYCARKSPSRREVQCSASYQCSVSLFGLPEIEDDTKANVTVILKVPGMPRVNPDNIQSRSTVVTWSYPSLGSDEAPITSYTLQYQNSLFSHNTDISDGTFRKRLVNLKPYTAYTVRVAAKSVLGTGNWSSHVRFTTSAAVPDVTPQFTNATALTSRTIYVEWQEPNLDKINGPRTRYFVYYKELGAGVSGKRVRVPEPSTSYLIQNLKIWTTYQIRIVIHNGVFYGPRSSIRRIKTKQDAPSAPENLQFNVQGPTGNKRPQMTVTWTTPANQNGVIKEYTLNISYAFKGKLSSLKRNLDSDIFSYSFDVLGGIQYTIKLWAVTVKPGTAKAKVKEIPVYKPSIAPRNITSQKINETTYSIMWNPLPREMSNGKVQAYEVRRTRVTSSRHARAVSIPAVQFQNTTDTFAILHDMTSCSEYSVSVRAYTSAGPGVFGGLPSRIVTTDEKPVRIRTTRFPCEMQQAPSPPSDVKTDKPEKRSLTLLWNKPKLHGDDVKHYTVTYEGSKDYYPEFRHADSVKTTSLAFTVVNLYPGTKYNFVVIATTHCGDGDNSTMATSTTLMDAPLAPIVRKIENISTTESSVNVTIWYALQTNGPISHYQFLVHLVKEWSDTVSDWNELAQDVYYICAQVPTVSEDPSMVFVIGDGKNYSGFINKALLSGQKYKIYSRGLTFNSKKRSAEEEFLTGKAALIANVEVEEVPMESSSNEQKGDSTAAIAASVVVALLLVGVAFIVGVIFWRRRRRADEPRLKTNEMYPLRAVNRAYNRTLSVDGVSQESPPTGEESVQRVENTGEPIYGNAELEKVEDAPKPVPVNQFSEYVTLLKRDNNAGFEKQYALLMPGQQFPCDVAKKPENKNKNRYGNIIVYDHSRVKLPLIKGSKNSDYINACYLHGYDGTPNTYIACQGPVPGTYQDFWRMIWQENATTVVMLTQLVENGRTKCNQYWPEKSETYHDITVTNQRTETFADYAVRTFVLCQKGSGERRQVQHFNFLVWPDKGVPRHATAVLGLRRKVRANHKDSTPLVVHCSAGIGRTGAFIVTDAMMESAQNREVVDVFNYIQLLRTNRMSMVQTDEQYGFIYMALVEAITCGNTEIPAQDLRIAVRKLADVNPKTKMSGLASEYQRLDLITADDFADREDDVARKPQNASKNRFPDIVPLNGPRVVLPGDEKNDYINASFVDTYRERNSFIMTQAPLENTIEDFWRMIWDYNIGTIVMLNELKEKGQVYPMYWASEGSTIFGEFVIETNSHKIFQDFSEREFTVAKKKDPKAIRHVRHYQVTGWPDKGVPRNAQYILDMINKVEGSQRKSSSKAPVVVQCSDGVGRSGTFCAILSIIERLKSEQVIDVCQSVKVIRVNRPGAVNCKTQYVFCYKVVEKYLDSFNDYSNFE